MKINTETRTVGRHGTSEERQFNIKGSAKAFKILSDGLYSDKVTAVIRELSCNAKDAHVDAGRADIPFEIHLPNTLEPWFAVTDTGIGLSNEDVLNMYSTYFESTKTDSNNVTGCLGLGSKSPFAYVDSFTVESRWNGTLTLFSCFYNEEGIPAITIMGDPMETDEHNGLTIKMAVKNGDMNEFAQKAMVTLNRFNPTPTVTGNTDYEIKPKTYMVEGTNWKLLDGETSYREANVHAIQGNVTYPVSSNSLGQLTRSQSSIMELSIDIAFNIGDLDVAANREALGYDENTIANIKATLDVIASEISPLFQDKFKGCKNLWTARIMFKEVINNLPYGLQNILSDNDVGLKWKKQSLSDVFKIDRDNFKDLSIVNFQRNTRGGRGQTADWGYNNDMKFAASSEILFFYDDVGHGSHSRLTHFLETDSEAKRQQVLVKTDNKKILKKFSKALGNVTLQPISNLPKRPKAERSARRVTSKVLAYTGRSHDRRDSWNPTELDLKDGGIFVMINRYKVYDLYPNVSGGGTYEKECNDFNTIVELAKSNNIIDLTDKTIYGIRKGDVAKMKDDSGWVNLFDLIRDKLAVTVKKEKVSQIMADLDGYTGFDCDIRHFIETLDSTKMIKGSSLAIFLKAHDYMKSRNTERAQAISEVAHKVNFTIGDGKPKHNLVKLWEAVQEKYPLIKLMSDQSLRGGYYSNSSCKDDNYNALTDYIELIDAQDKSGKPKLKRAA